MNDQKHFSEYGCELTSAAQALVGFEGAHRKEIADLVDDHQRITSKADDMAGKLAQAKADMDKRLGSFHQGLAEMEAKTLADLRAELGKKQKTKLGLRLAASDDALEQEVVAALEKKAHGILGLRGRYIDNLKLELELAELRLKAAMIAEKPFRLRQAAALGFFRALLGVAQIDVRHVESPSGFDMASALSDTIKRLTERLGIAAGTLEHFYPLHYQAASPDAILEFALQLPEATFAQVLTGWRTVRLGGGKTASLTYCQTGVLKWRFKRSRIADQPRMISTSDFSSGGQSAEQAAWTAKRRQAQA